MENPAGRPVAPGPPSAQTWRLIDTCEASPHDMIGASILVFLPPAWVAVVDNARAVMAARPNTVLHVFFIIGVGCRFVLRGLGHRFGSAVSRSSDACAPWYPLEPSVNGSAPPKEAV